MVSKITIFEPHLDGVQIGPASMDGEQTEDAESHSESSSGWSLRRFLVGAGVLAGVVVLGVTLLRRARRNEDSETEDEPTDVVLEDDSSTEAPAQ